MAVFFFPLPLMFSKWLFLCLIKELWATDNNKVQEFIFGYLKDPLREVEQPYFQQDEVHTLSGPGTLLSVCFSISPPEVFFSNRNIWICFCKWNFPVPHCAVDVTEKCSGTDMNTHDLGLLWLIPHSEKRFSNKYLEREGCLCDQHKILNG